MNKIEKLSEEEVKTLEKLYTKNYYKFLFSSLLTLFVSFLIYIIFNRVPVKYLGRRGAGRGINETVTENLGHAIPIGILLFFAFIFILVLNNELKITKLKKDLKHRIKIIATLKVAEIENYADDKIKDLKEMGITSTNLLIFKRNPFGIKNYPFNKFTNPEMVKAKEMNLEIAKFSKHEFKRNIVVRN